MVQTNNGSTINVNVSINSTTGQYIYNFNDPFSLNLYLNNSTGTVVSFLGSNNNKINLLSASGVTINGGKGNNIYNISATAGGLNGNIIHGSTGYDFITLSGSNTQIDLTQGARGIEGVVGRNGLNGETVTVSLNQLVSSAVTNGGTGRAFAAVIGLTGAVNVLETGKFHLVGVVDSASNGFDASGNTITGTALSDLLNSVTQISNVTGNLASLYAGSATGTVPANETEVANQLSAYVFSDGTKSYTIWTDGTVTPTDIKGNVLAPVYHPGAATPTQPFTYGSVALFDKTSDWAQATLSTDVNGVSTIKLSAGDTSAYSAIALKAGVTGTKVLGDSGANGQNWFGLGQSGGNNHIVGSKGGNLFDLQLSGSLQDWLTGGTGFDIVKAVAAGADVDLTANNASGHAATSIDAVVGSLNPNNTQTVELDLTKLQYVTDATGAKSAVFEALLGSVNDVLTLSGAGKWLEVSTFAPGSALPDHAAALAHADLLDAAFGSPSHTAENSLTGHLFEQLDGLGHVLKYVTVYTDATIDNLLTPPATTLALDHIIL